VAEQYDIFSGGADNDPMWVEAAETLDAAQERMKSLALSKPGSYFIFCSKTRTVVARSDENS
jgi:hypothetical protein